MLHCREPVRDHQGGFALALRLHSGDYLGLRPGIQRAGGFVQDQNGRVFQKSSGQADALFLPAGEADAFGACERLVAVWQCHNKIISHGIPGCLPDFFLSGIFPAKADIFFNGSVKQISVLLHIGDLRPQIGQLQASDVFSVYVNIAGIRFIETGDQAAEDVYKRQTPCGAR